MNPYRLALVGDDRRSQALNARLQPDSPFRHGDFALQRRVAAAEWRSLLSDDTIDAVYLGCPPVERTGAAIALLAAGKAVLTCLPLAETAAELAALGEAVRAGKAPLLVTTDLRNTLAGQTALQLVEAGELGRLHSIYLGLRWAASHSGSDPAVEHEERLWEAIDLVTALAGAAPERLYAVQAGGDDPPPAVVFNARFPSGAIATGEVGALLPAGAPVVAPEADLELAGETGGLRCEPYKQAVLVAGPAATQPAVRNWHTDPVVTMLADFGTLLSTGKSQGGIDPAALAGLLDAMEALRASLATGAAVKLPSVRQ
jgi:predicted dehydrogenase